MKLARFLALAFTLCLALAAAAQAAPVDPWQDLDASRLPAPARELSAYRAAALDRGALLDLLARVPAEDAEGERPELALPLPGGGRGVFAIEEAPVMEAELAARYPEIRTFHGRGVSDPTALVRLDLTPSGFHAMVLGPEGTTFVDPFAPDDLDRYLVYAKHALPARSFSCAVHGEGATRAGSADSRVSAGTVRKTYRLALAGTGEYTAAVGGTVSAGLSAMATTVNRVNGIYERDLAARLVLVANNNLLVYTNGATDPYSNNDGEAMLAQNVSNLNAVIGSANYDIGHVFSTGGGGVAGLGVVCGSNKAMGVTGRGSPTGDAFDVDYVAHEMGHQFDGSHTFNGTTGSCGGGNRDGAHAFEVGSGSTIQAYAGICGAEDLQAHSDDYFHGGSLDEMIPFISASGCGTSSSLGNSIPTVSAGADFTVPARTPFTLTASGSDANGDALTYDWEEMDLGTASPPSTDNGSRPLFRSFLPTSSPSRTLPRLSDILNNTSTFGETLPTTSRTMRFRATVRDGRGGSNSDEMLLTVRGDAGPFLVTSPNSALSWPALSAQTVTWSVANTASFAPSVRLLLSTDGGASFPTVLVASTANDGSEVVTVPNLQGSATRVKVEAAGGVFFDVSDVNFTVGPPGAVLNVDDMVALEGDAPTSGVFQVRLNPAAAQTVTVGYSTAGGTATSGVDFLPASGTLTFTAGATSALVPVTIVGDQIDEPEETFVLTLAGAAGGATIGDGQATGTIIDDDVPSLSVSSTSLPAASPITVSAAEGPAQAGDWVGLFAAGGANPDYLDWLYLNGTQSMPASGLSAATLSFTLPFTAGSYEFRFFRDNSYLVLATSPLVTVTAPTTPLLQVQPASLAFGTLTVGAATTRAVVVKNVGIGTLSGTASVSGAGYRLIGATSYALGAGQSLELTLEFAPGGTGSLPGTLTATGASGATVALTGAGTSGPSVFAQLASAVPTQTLRASVVNGPANATDWVALAAVGAADASLLDWSYLNGSKTAPAAGLSSATVSFPAPGAGSYELRLFASNGFTRLATSAPIKVAAATAPVFDVDTTALAFGAVNVGSSADRSLTVKNAGTGTVAGQASTSSNGYSIVSDPAYTLGAGQSKVLTVRLTPSQVAAYPGSISLTGGSTPFTVALSGSGVTAPTVSAPASVSGGQSGTVTIANGPGNATDWVALAAVGAANATYLDWRYLNGLQAPPASGLTAATLSLTFPTTPGDYEVRLFASNGFTRLATSGAVNVPAPPPPSVGVGATSAVIGQSVTATVANGPGSATDWLALAATSAGNTTYVDWKYLSGTQTPPGTGLTAATVSFTMPSAAGTYEVRFFASNGFTRLATSPSITVTLPVNPVLEVTPTSLAFGSVPTAGFSERTVTVKNAGGGTLNGTASVTGTGYSVQGAAAYALGFNQTQVITVRLTSPALGANPGTLTLTGGAGATVPITATGVNGPSASIPATANGGQAITAALAGGPANPTDWAGLFRAGAADSGYLEWKYLNGLQTAPAAGLSSANLPFTLPAGGGTYEVRFFASNGFTRLATSNVLTAAGPSITATATVNAGQTITVTIANGPANATDWVGLHTLAGPDNAYSEWKYLNGTQTPPGAGLASGTLTFTAPLTPGQYQLRFFASNGSTRLAVSNAVTVN